MAFQHRQPDHRFTHGLRFSRKRVHRADVRDERGRLRTSRSIFTYQHGPAHRKTLDSAARREMEDNMSRLLIVTALAALPLAAQNFGEITGTVSDSTGAVIAGAAVSLTNSATNQVRRVVTNDTGAYSAPFLVPGLYDLRVETPGFKA